MSYLDTLFINGHDIRTAWSSVIVVGEIGWRSPGDRRGDDEVIPGRRGVLDTQLVRDAFVIPVSIRVLGASRGERNDNWRTVLADMRGTNHGLVPLKVRIATGTGSSYDQFTARGRVLSAASSIINPYSGQVSLQIKNLDGAWKDAAGNWSEEV